MGMFKKIKHVGAKLIGSDSKSKAKRRFDRAVDGAMPSYRVDAVDKVRASKPETFVGRHPRAGELMEMRQQVLTFADRRLDGAELLARATADFKARVVDGKRRPGPEGLPDDVWSAMMSVVRQREAGLITAATAAADAEDIVGAGKKDALATAAGAYLAAYEAVVVFLAGRAEKDARKEAKADLSKELHARGDLADLRKRGYESGSSKLLMVDRVVGTLEDLKGQYSREEQISMMSEAIAKAMAEQAKRATPPLV